MMENDLHFVRIVRDAHDDVVLLIAMARPEYEVISPEAWERTFLGFFERRSHDSYISDQLEQLVAKPDESAHYSLLVDCQTLMNHSRRAALVLLRYPERLLPLFDQAARDAQRRMLRGAAAGGGGGLGRRWTVKPHVSVRLTGVSVAAEHLKPTVTSMRSSDIGAYVQVRQISQAGAVKRRRLVTETVSRHRDGVRQSNNTPHTLASPLRAPRCGSRRGRARAQVAGTVIRAGSVKMLETRRDYTCSRSANAAARSSL